MCRSVETLKMISCMFFICALSCSGCDKVLEHSMSGDYKVALPNGYALIRSNAYDVAIWNPEEGTYHQRSRIIAPLITGISVQGDWVLGLVEDSHNPWLLEKNERAKVEKAEQEKARGYFLLNTKTHNVQIGLTKETWLTVLKDNGIQSEPQLERPSRSFRY